MNTAAMCDPEFALCLFQTQQFLCQDVVLAASWCLLQPCPHPQLVQPSRGPADDSGFAF